MTGPHTSGEVSDSEPRFLVHHPRARCLADVSAEKSLKI